MTLFLEFRELIKNFVTQNSAVASGICKFVLAFVSINVISNTAGGDDFVGIFLTALVLSLVCAFMPVNFTVFSSAVISVYFLKDSSLIMAGVMASLYIITFLMYMSYTPENGWIILLAFLLMSFHQPMFLPVAVGLMKRPAASLSVVLGVFFYEMFDMISVVNAQLLSGEGTDVGAESLLLNQLLSNKVLVIYVTASVITVCVVYLISRIHFDYSYITAGILGLILEFLIYIGAVLIGNIHLSVLMIVLRFFIALVMILFFVLWNYNLDYSRSEFLEFEDADYRYFVKAVPKSQMSVRDKKIHRIN